MLKKNKDIMPFIITICIFMLLLFLLIAGGVGYYSLYQGQPGLVALYMSLRDMMLLRFHASVYYGNYYTVAIVLYVILVLLFYIEQGRYAHDAGGIEAGSAKWNDDIKQFNRKYNEPLGVDKSDSFNNTILSKNVSLSMDDLETQLNNNVMVLGPAGSGKSRFVVKPNILQAMSGNCSMIISDPSGELYRSTSKCLEENGVEIRVFNLLNMRYSGFYNPFRYVQDDAGVGILIDTLIENTTPGEQSGKGDPFWEKSEKALLSACIYYVKDFCAQEYQTFGTVLSIIRLEQLSENVAVNQESILDKLFTGKVILKNGNVVELKNKDERAAMEAKLRNSLAWKNYMVFKLGGVRTLKSILISAAVRLNPFNVPELENLTSRDTVDLYSLGDKRVALFLIIPQTSKTYNFLASILYTQTFEVLYQQATTKPGARLPVPVRLVLDEFVVRS